MLVDDLSIRQYIVDTARKYRVEDKIHYGLRLAGGADQVTMVQRFVSKLFKQRLG